MTTKSIELQNTLLTCWDDYSKAQSDCEALEMRAKKGSSFGPDAEEYSSDNRQLSYKKTAEKAKALFSAAQLLEDCSELSEKTKEILANMSQKRSEKFAFLAANILMTNEHDVDLISTDNNHHLVSSHLIGAYDLSKGILKLPEQRNAETGNYEIQLDVPSMVVKIFDCFLRMQPREEIGAFFSVSKEATHKTEMWEMMNFVSRVAHPNFERLMIEVIQDKLAVAHGVDKKSLYDKYENAIPYSTELVESLVKNALENIRDQYMTINFVGEAIWGSYDHAREKRAISLRLHRNGTGDIATVPGEMTFSSDLSSRTAVRIMQLVLTSKNWGEISLRLENDDFKPIGRILEKGGQLKRLFVESKGLSRSSLRALIKALPDDNKIYEIEFDRPPIGSSLHRHAAMSYYHEGGVFRNTFEIRNRLHADRGIEIAELLDRSPDLNIFTLRHHAINDASCQAMSEAISRHQSLKTVEFDCCTASDLGLARLINGIKSNTSIDAVRIKMDTAYVLERDGVFNADPKNVYPQTRQALLELVRENKRLRCLNLEIPFSSNEIDELIDVAVQSPKLERLFGFNCGPAKSLDTPRVRSKVTHEINILNTILKPLDNSQKMNFITQAVNMFDHFLTHVATIETYKQKQMNNAAKNATREAFTCLENSYKEINRIFNCEKMDELKAINTIWYNSTDDVSGLRVVSWSICDLIFTALSEVKASDLDPDKMAVFSDFFANTEEKLTAFSGKLQDIFPKEIPMMAG